MKLLYLQLLLLMMPAIFAVAQGFVDPFCNEDDYYSFFHTPHCDELDLGTLSCDYGEYYNFFSGCCFKMPDPSRLGSCSVGQHFNHFRRCCQNNHRRRWG
jgi:hypothetical protein